MPNELTLFSEDLTLGVQSWPSCFCHRPSCRKKGRKQKHDHLTVNETNQGDRLNSRNTLTANKTNQGDRLDSRKTLTVDATNQGDRLDSRNTSTVNETNQGDRQTKFEQSTPIQPRTPGPFDFIQNQTIFPSFLRIRTIYGGPTSDPLDRHNP